MDALGIGQRRLGTAMLAFGLIGVVVAGIAALGLLAGAVAARNLDDRLAADQAQLVATLDQVTATVGRLADTTANASTTLATTGQTLGYARDVLDQLASVSDELSASLDISILGQRPLSGAASRFGDLATRVRVFRDDADALAAKLATNAADVTTAAGDIHRLESRLDSLSTRVEAFDRIGDIVALMVAGVLLGGLLVAWLAVAAGFCAWAGWRLRRLPVVVAEAGTGQRQADRGQTDQGPADREQAD